MDMPTTVTRFTQSDLALYGGGIPLASTAKRDFTVFLRRYRRRLGLAFLLTALLAIGLSFVPTERYRGDAVMIIRLGPEYVYQAASGTVAQPGQALPFSNDQIFKSELAILNSAGLHAEVVKELGVETLYPQLLHPGWRARFQMDVQNAITAGLIRLNLLAPVAADPDQAKQRRLADAVRLFEQNLKVALLKESAVISVSFQNPNAAVVSRALQVLLRDYLEKRQQIYSQDRSGLVADELHAAQQRLAKAATALQDFKSHNDVFNFATQRDSLLARRNAAEAEIATLTADVAAGTRNVAALASSASAAGPTILQYSDRGADTSFAATRTRLIDAEAKLKLAQARYAPGSPVVALARRDVEDVRSILQSSESKQTPVVRMGRNTTYDSIDQDRMKADAALKATEARRAVVQTTVADLNRQLKGFEALESRHADLEQQVAITRESVTQFSHKLDNVRALDDQESARADAVRIVQQPTVSPHPTSLQPMIIGGGMLMAVLVMLGVAAWTEFSRRGFLTPDEIERDVGLPVLGVLPYRSLRRLHG